MPRLSHFVPALHHALIKARANPSEDLSAGVEHQAREYFMGLKDGKVETCVCFPWLWTHKVFCETVFLSIELVYCAMFLKGKKMISRHLLLYFTFGLCVCVC